MSSNSETTTWICDSCGKAIESVQEGWIEWLTRKNGSEGYVAKGLRLVHHRPVSPRNFGCQYDEKAEFAQDRSTVRDRSLTDFLGSDGLMLLLSHISEGELPIEELLEMIKRLHIPGYEHARRHFADAIHAGVFEPNTKEGYYDQSDVRAVLDWLANRHT